MLNRAYTLLEIKSASDDDRIIRGIASTPTPDAQGDIMEPKGAKFSLPLPLLWQHDRHQPIGHVIEAKATDRGIEIKAQIKKIDEPGPLKDRLDTAWLSVKSGLVRGLSVGWKPIEFAQLAKGGLHVTKWFWAELSAVTLPMNADATILALKSFDAPFLAASGTDGQGDAPLSAGVPASVPRAPVRGVKTMSKTIAQQIADCEAKRAANEARMTEIMTKSAEDGTIGLNEADGQEYDDLKTEVATVDAHLVRLRDLEKTQVAKAKPVVVETKAQGSEARSASPVVRVSESMPADVAFGAMVLCKAAAFSEISRGTFITAEQIARQRYPSDTLIAKYFQEKTAVAGGTTTDSNFAASLLPPAQVLESAFLEYLRPMTLIGKFGTNGIPSLNRVPFNVKIQSQTTGASANWVGEGKGKPVTKFNTTDTTLLFTKVAAISVITEELARFSRPGAETLVRNELAKAVIAKLDSDFVDPDNAVSSGVRPASITNGLTAKTSAGTSAANVLTDIQSIVNPFILLNYDVSDLVLLMPNSLALTLSLMQNSLGQDSFKGMTVNGGTLAGLPVITSQYLASGASYGNMVVCVSASNVALADDGRVQVDASREASIQMEDASTMDATAGTGQTSVSMFQTNSIAIRAEREISWKKLRSTAVVFMDDVNWGSIGSPY